MLVVGVVAGWMGWLRWFAGAGGVVWCHRGTGNVYMNAYDGSRRFWVWRGQLQDMISKTRGVRFELYQRFPRH